MVAICVMGCADDLREREDEMLPRKQSEKEDRSPQWINDQRKKLGKVLL